MEMEIAKLVVSILGFGGTIVALIFGLRQYKRSEQWKREEFVAKEIKEFESNPIVRNALLMIDWGGRRINLFLVPVPAPADFIKITREDQWRALVPHPIKDQYLSPSNEAIAETDVDGNPKRKFTANEAKIRDTYDAFLDHLERFSNFIDSKLISADEFKPYLIYWIDSIANVENIEDYEGDAEWRCTLLTYINYYKYSGVKSLFNIYGRNIDSSGDTFIKLKGQIKNKQLYDDLINITNRKKLGSSNQVGKVN
jgi:hypothetical protein